MNTKIGLIGIFVGFVLYVLITSLFNFFKFFSILPFFSFLAGIGIGYFIKEFKECLIYGGISVIIGISVVFGLNFEHLNNNLLGVMGLNAMGLFFGFGFGGIVYYRHKRKVKIVKKVSKE